MILQADNLESTVEDVIGDVLCIMSQTELISVQTKQICVVISKMDVPGKLNKMQINTLLCLPELKSHLVGRLTVIELSSSSLQGVDTLLQFIIQQHAKSSNGETRGWFTGVLYSGKVHADS